MDYTKYASDLEEALAEVLSLFSQDSAGDYFFEGNQYSEYPDDVPSLDEDSTDIIVRAEELLSDGGYELELEEELE